MAQKLSLIQGETENQSIEKLKQFYEGEFIPAEKKPYLSHLDKALGPFLATEQGQYLLDASSQIASLGLGFNPNAFFGTAHFLESWLNLKNTQNVNLIQQAYAGFVARKLGWNKASLSFGNSGAEANEVALGDAFSKRKHAKQTKVLAFEGSFHGRFLVSLASTWNPAKRALFEWPGFKSVFVAYPEMKSDYSKQPALPKEWQALWQRVAETKFENLLKPYVGKNALLDQEVESLLKIREHLAANEIFAILVEPMQCEGGDRYASFRFHQALLNMAKTFEVPLIYDEVQTGFALGGPFFWHKLFDLRDSLGKPLAPDYVVCGKKAQVGMVVSHEPIPFKQQFATHSWVRGYIHAMALDQSQGQIEKIEKSVRKELVGFCKQFKQQIHSPRSQGLAFSVDFHDKDLLGQFVKARFKYGMLYYPAGSHTARFRLNLSFTPKEITFLFDQLKATLSDCLGKKTSASNEYSYRKGNLKIGEFHRTLTKWQLAQLKTGKRPSPSEAKKSIEAYLQASLPENLQKTKLVIVNQKNFSKYRAKVLKLQKLAYEPVRQTPVEDFLTALRSKKGFGIILEKGADVVGIGFFGDLSKFPNIRGTRVDPRFHNPNTLYSVDITVNPKFQGLGLGRILRSMAVMLAFQKGVEAIHGRNRDRLAGQMLLINLSLGSYELQHLFEDYPDEDEFRDCIYYSNPIQWEQPPLNLSSALESPWALNDLTPQFIENGFSKVINKVCLSNFVSESFLSELKAVSKCLPSKLRHLYTTSGQSECVDKAIKSIWHTRKIERVLTFEGCFFGHGSFMSRALSGKALDFFPVDRLPFPSESNNEAVLSQVENRLGQQKYQSVWVEPLAQESFNKIPVAFLKKLRELCHEHDTPLVSNDTASLFSRYSRDNFVASQAFDPDLAFAYLGGQIGIVYAEKKWFVSDPLAMISTWDGDEFSLYAFHSAMVRFLAEKEKHFALRAEFSVRLKDVLSRYELDYLNLENGYGAFRGAVPQSIATLFTKNAAGDYLICPTEMAMADFLKLTRKW